MLDLSTTQTQTDISFMVCVYISSVRTIFRLHGPEREYKRACLLLRLISNLHISVELPIGLPLRIQVSLVAPCCDSRTVATSTRPDMVEGRP